MGKILTLFLTFQLIQFSLEAQSMHMLDVSINQPANCPVVASLSQAELFKVFPNPVSESFMIEVPTISHALVTLIDIQGREVFSGQLKRHSMQVDVSGMRKGVYILRVQTADKLEKIKISIQ